ncbi:MAG: hypothetical protein Q8P71_01130 [bacterium]|nr:hypothetical protein [bacterium]
MSNSDESICFYADNFQDYRGKPITLCWSEKLWITHIDKHPEIIDLANTSKLISKAILEPSLVLTGYDPRDGKEMLVCYYREYKRHGNNVYFCKVVVGCRGTELYVKTVFEEWALCDVAVQEKRYDFEELYRDENTYL